MLIKALYNDATNRGTNKDVLHLEYAQQCTHCRCKVHLYKKMLPSAPGKVHGNMFNSESDEKPLLTQQCKHNPERLSRVSL